MPRVRFGRKDEPVTEFVPSEDLVAVRTDVAQPRTSAPVRGPLEAVVEGPPVLAFPEANVAVYRGERAAAADVAAAKSYLTALDGVRFAGRVLLEARTGEPVVYTENL